VGKHGISLDELQTLWGLFVDKKTPVKNGLDRSTNLRKLGLTFHLDNFEELNDWIASLEQLKSLGADVLAGGAGLEGGGEVSGGGLPRVGAERRVGVGVRRDSWKGIRWRFWRIGLSFPKEFQLGSLEIPLTELLC
jgi:hypothetical protein